MTAETHFAALWSRKLSLRYFYVTARRGLRWWQRLANWAEVMPICSGDLFCVSFHVTSAVDHGACRLPGDSPVHNTQRHRIFHSRFTGWLLHVRGLFLFSFHFPRHVFDITHTDHKLWLTLGRFVAFSEKFFMAETDDQSETWIFYFPDTSRTSHLTNAT